MREFSTKSYLDKKAGLSDIFSRGYDMLSRATKHEAWKDLTRGSPLDPTRGALGVAMNFMEQTGFTDQQARNLINEAKELSREISRVDPSCDSLSSMLKDIVNYLYDNPSMESEFNSSRRSWRSQFRSLFDYRFSSWNRAYNEFLGKHTNGVGITDKKARDLADQAMKIIFDSAINLRQRVEQEVARTHGTITSPLCP